MANKHFGNLADVFKHVVLAECLGAMRPGEYWESHAGRAINLESEDVPTERAHGIHTFLRLADTSAALRSSPYMRALRKISLPLPAMGLRQIPGSALIARRLWGCEARRYLLCDTDADSLLNIRQELPAAAGSGDRELSPGTLECVPEDGISVLRGAGMLLPAEWTASVLAFLDPYDMEVSSDAGISALQLACELGNRDIKVLMFYAFDHEECRRRRQDVLQRELTKARLAGPKAGGRWFEGSLRVSPPGESCPTQWGFGMLGLNLPVETLAAIDERLRGLEAVYENVELTTGMSGAWHYARGPV
jgi:hypothetical protein